MSSYYLSLFLDQASTLQSITELRCSCTITELFLIRQHNCRHWHISSCQSGRLPHPATICGCRGLARTPFNKKINSAVWLSFVAFLTLAANTLNSTVNLFSMI
jgi:hypothetical protein